MRGCFTDRVDGRLTIADLGMGTVPLTVMRTDELSCATARCDCSWSFEEQSSFIAALDHSRASLCLTDDESKLGAPQPR
jgi:hypothetical protein